MKIKKFKLLDEGLGGIQIEASEYLASGKFQIVDDVVRTRKIMLSDELITELKKLKYFLLNLSGHWIPPFANYYDSESKTLLPAESDASKVQLLLKDLWNKVAITGGTMNEKGFLLTGTIEVIDGKKMGFATPFVTPDDDIGFFLEATELLDGIGKRIAEYIGDQAIPLEQARKQVPAKLLEGKTEEEIFEAVADYMMSRGAIVIMNGSNEPDQLPETTNSEPEPEVHQSTKSIDSHNQPEAEEATEGDPPWEDEAEPETTTGKKTEPFGPPAADIPADVSGDVPKPKEEVERGGPQGEDLTSLEHSENMGIPAGAEDEGSQEEDDW